MKKFTAGLFLVFGLLLSQQGFATDHYGYPADTWVIQNYCTEPVHVTVTNLKGEVEIVKLLLAHETYTQKMAFEQKQGPATYNTKVTAVRPNSHVPVDYQIGGAWDGFRGSMIIRIPYFHYNPGLDSTGCMKK